MTYPAQTTPTPMTRLNIYIDGELRRQLEALSASTGAPMGEISRRAILAWLQLQEPPNARKVFSKRDANARIYQQQQSSGGFTVTDPRGVVHTFPDQTSANAFKKAAGIQ